MSMSGIKCSDQVKCMFERLNKDKEFKYIMFKIAKCGSDGHDEVVVDEEGCCKSDDKGKKFGETRENIDCLKRYLETLNEGRYIVLDVREENVKGGLCVAKPLFISWNPDGAPIKSKMKYASTAKAVTGTLSMGGKSLHCADSGDLNFERVIENMI